jgi:hypothetical protein
MECSNVTFTDYDGTQDTFSDNGMGYEFGCSDSWPTSETDTGSDTGGSDTASADTASTDTASTDTASTDTASTDTGIGVEVPPDTAIEEIE